MCNISPYPLPLVPPSHHPYPTPLGGHKVPNWSPSAVQLLPTSYLFYICSVYMSVLLSYFIPFYPSPSPCPQVHSLCLHLYSCPAPRFIKTIFFYIPYICVSIWYLFFSHLLHSVWQILGPSISRQVTHFCFFLWLSNIPLYICATLLYPLICQWTLRLLLCPGYCK